MGFIQNIMNKFGYVQNPFDQKPTSWVEHYHMLKMYYDNNDLYKSVQQYALENNRYVEKMRPIGNPAYNSVSFFESKLLPGKSIQVNTENQKVKDAILLFHKWSNLDSIKSELSKNLALYGDLFLKIVVTSGKLYLESVEPEFVTLLETDKRNYITTIRIDVPQVDEDNRAYWYTEYWNKQDGYFVTYKNYLGPSAKLEDIDTANIIQSGTLRQMGIDFIPIVWIPFSKTSTDERGKNCFEHCLVEIDEYARQVTKLHQQFFRNNQAAWVLKHTDPGGNGKPAITNSLPENVELELEENSILDLPNNTELQSATPNLPYADGLAIVKNIEMQLQKKLPEIKYFNLEGNLSGKAIRSLLTSACDRALIVQSAVLAGLVRCDQIALSMGEYFGIFSGIGNYADGDLDHTLSCEDMFPLDFDEKIIALQGLTTAGISLTSALKMLKFSEKEIEDIVKDSANNQATQTNAFIDTFNR